MADGTAAAPGLYFSADTNTGLYRPANDTLSIATNGAEALRVTATGSVGIGTTTPAAKLHVYGADALDAVLTLGPGTTSSFNGFNIGYGGGSFGAGTSFINAHSSGGSSGQLYFYTDNTFRMAINSAGNVGIGTTSPLARLGVYTTVANDGVAIDGTNTPSIRFADAGTIKGWLSLVTSAGSMSSDASADDLVLRSNVNKILFNTNNGGASTLAINGGNVGIGTTGPTSRLHVAASGSSDTVSAYSTGAYSAVMGNATTSGYAAWFGVSGGGTCWLGLSNTNWTCGSDIRLKKDVQPISDALEKIQKINGISFLWKKGTHAKSRTLGVIAQEVQKVFPEVVSRGKDGYLAVDYAVLTAPLIEAVKELKTENDTLRAQLKAQDEAFDARLKKLEEGRK